MCISILYTLYVLSIKQSRAILSNKRQSIESLKVHTFSKKHYNYCSWQIQVFHNKHFKFCKQTVPMFPLSVTVFQVLKISFSILLSFFSYH